jgi:hypothetical protein
MFIEESSRADVLEMSKSFFSGKTKVCEGCCGYETGSVQTHEAMNEDRVSITNQVCNKLCEGVEF